MEDLKFMAELCDYIEEARALEARLRREVACKNIIDKYCPKGYSDVMRFFPGADTVDGVLTYLRPEAEAGVAGVQQAVEEIERLFLLKD